MPPRLSLLVCAGLLLAGACPLPPLHAAKGDSPEKPAKPEKPEKPDNAGKPEKVEKPDKSEKPDKAEKPAKAERGDAVTRGSKAERTDKSGKAERKAAPAASSPAVANGAAVAPRPNDFERFRVVVDDRERNYFPMPIEAQGQGDVLAGRIHPRRLEHFHQLVSEIPAESP